MPQLGAAVIKVNRQECTVCRLDIASKNFAPSEHPDRLLPKRAKEVCSCSCKSDGQAFVADAYSRHHTTDFIKYFQSMGKVCLKVLQTLKVHYLQLKLLIGVQLCCEGLDFEGGISGLHGHGKAGRDWAWVDNSQLLDGLLSQTHLVRDRFTCPAGSLIEIAHFSVPQRCNLASSTEHDDQWQMGRRKCSASRKLHDLKQQGTKSKKACFDPCRH